VIPKDTNDPGHIRNLAFISLLWDTGARNGEVLSLNKGDLDMGRMRAIIKTEKSKGRRPIREIFWTENTNDNIWSWLKKREDLEKKMTFQDPDALFLSICSGQHNTSGKRFSTKGVGEMLRRYSRVCRQLKLPKATKKAAARPLGNKKLFTFYNRKKDYFMLKLEYN